MTTRTRRPNTGRSGAEVASVPTRTSRAVLRDVEPGSTVECVKCGERVKFQAKIRHKQVICNVYVDGQWNRVEHFHADCYGPAGEPHGPVDTTPVSRIRASRSA
jgi:hypothetical protein